MKNLLWNISLIVIGIVLILFPAETLDIAITIIGIILLVCGAVGVVLGLKGEGAYQVYTMSGAAVSIVVGIIFLVLPDFVRSILPMIMGIAIVLSGILNVMTAISQKNAGAPRWGLSLVFAVITVILGIIILANLNYTANIMIRIIGFIYIYNGLSMLIMKVLNRT